MMLRNGGLPPTSYVEDAWPPPPVEEGPYTEIGCSCGYSCGTMQALKKHLARVKGVVETP